MPALSSTQRVDWLAAACQLGRRWIAHERAHRTSRTLVRAVAELIPRRRERRQRDSLTRAICASAIGGVYLIAFTSMRGQVLALYGKRGILPISQLLEHLRHAGPERYARVPTVLWLGDSDRALLRLCKAGQLASLAMLLGVAPRSSAFAAWGAYLSLVSVGQDFLSFQWDALILEAGVLVFTAAPASLLRWLVFRLYFESGSSKLQSGDPTWRNLTANRYHFETQPLPTRLGWYAHHLPPRALRASTGLALALECLAPFLALGPPGARRLGFWLLAGLQGGFALTGNFGFFNVLSLALSLSLLDEETLGRFLPARFGSTRSTLLQAPFFALSAVELASRFPRGRAALNTLGSATRALSKFDHLAWPFRPVGSYGLFAVMTLKRPEVIVEGSDDRVHWREYAFRYKPGDLSRPPSTMSPHMPRLDWQMWFAALGQPPEWFTAFVLRLLQGVPEVLGLLDGDPFQGRPPRYVRALLYDYRMTSLEERRQSGHWWRRELLGPYFPIVSLGVTDEPARPTLFA